MGRQEPTESLHQRAEKGADGVAGELAAENSAGPGSFAVSIIDALYNLEGPVLIARAKVS